MGTLINASGLHGEFITALEARRLLTEEEMLEQDWIRAAFHIAGRATIARLYGARVSGIAIDETHSTNLMCTPGFEGRAHIAGELTSDARQLVAVGGWIAERIQILKEEEAEDLELLRQYLVEVFTIGELSRPERAELEQLGRSELASLAVRCMEVLEEYWREVAILVLKLMPGSRARNTRQ